MSNFPKLIVLCVFMIMIGGCNHFDHLFQAQSPTKYSPNIGNNQTVMVIPFNQYLPQIEAAGKVEMALVEYGFNVKAYQTPDVKEVEKHTGAGINGARIKDNVDANEGAGLSAQARAVTIERYRSYNNINADYTFEVLVSGYKITVKVVRTGDNSIIGITEFAESSASGYIFRKFLLEHNLLVEKKI